MKKSLQQLFATAAKLQRKYASIDANTIKNQIQQTIQTDVGNASTVQSMGIMPFVKMLQSSNSNLRISVTRNGDDIAVSDPVVTPGSEAPKFTALTTQIQSYLDRHMTLFPTHKNGEPITYSNLTITLNYGTAQNTAPR